MAYDWLESWLMSRPGAEHDYKAEWGWDRYMVRGKLFAAICSPSGMTDTRYNGHTLVNLKCDPRLGELLRERYPERCVRLPMISEARSLNLANTVAAVTYEALRQQDFPGLAADGPAAWARQKSGQIRR